MATAHVPRVRLVDAVRKRVFRDRAAPSASRPKARPSRGTCLLKSQKYGIRPVYAAHPSWRHLGYATIHIFYHHYIHRTTLRSPPTRRGRLADAHNEFRATHRVAGRRAPD